MWCLNSAQVPNCKKLSWPQSSTKMKMKMVSLNCRSALGCMCSDAPDSILIRSLKKIFHSYSSPSEWFRRHRPSTFSWSFEIILKTRITSTWHQISYTVIRIPAYSHTHTPFSHLLANSYRERLYLSLNTPKANRNPWNRTKKLHRELKTLYVKEQKAYHFFPW